MKRLIIISSPHGAAEDGRLEDQRLEKLAVSCGVSTETLQLDCDGGSIGQLLDQVRPGPCDLAMHMGTLSRIHHDFSPGTTFQQLLHDRFSNILVYGVPAAGPDDALKSLADGAIQAIAAHPVQAVEYSLPREAKEYCAQLAGQSLVVSGERQVTSFEVQPGSGRMETIMAANGHPVFVRAGAAAGNLYLLAGGMPDVHEPLRRDTSLSDGRISLLPPLIFLRHCFPDACWRGGAAATARLTIDDPTLAKKYGALDIETLKASMRRLGYGASIAFIPWNYWRSTRGSAARFLSGDANLSLCIHGCDHTNHEFQSGSAPLLARKAALAMRRMEKHRNRVGVPFEDVMIFPQGHFSKAAIPALRSANYLATVNSTCFPIDYANELTLADFLFPAVTRFDGFPIFQRRYPLSLFEFSFDLFLGKPSLIVEHHDYFRDRCKGMDEFVAALQRIEPTLSWPGLSEQLMRSNMRRRGNDGSTEIRFFTRRFCFTPKAGEEGRCRLTRFEPNPDPVERVIAGGKNVDFDFEKDHLVLEIQAVPGQAETIEVVDRAASAAPVYSFGPVHNARVLVRRGLSEFRDGTLSRHKGLLKAANRVARALKATGDA